MNERLKIIAITFLLLINCVFAHTAASERQYSFSELFRMPANELLLTGNEYLTLRERPDSALMCFSIVAERYSPASSKEEQRYCAMAYNNCGFIYYYFNSNFPEAFNSLLTAKNISNQFEDDALTANIYLNLGNCYSMCFQLGLSSDVAQKALEYYSKGYELALKISNWEILLNCFSNLTMAPIMGNCPNYIAEQITSFSSVPLPADFPLYELYQLNYKAATCELRNDYKKALDYLNRQLELYHNISASAINQREIKAEILLGLSYCSEQIQELNSALDYANQLIEFARQINRPYYEVTPKSWTG